MQHALSTQSLIYVYSQGQCFQSEPHGEVRCLQHKQHALPPATVDNLGMGSPQQQAPIFDCRQSSDFMIWFEVFFYLRKHHILAHFLHDGYD